MIIITIYGRDYVAPAAIDNDGAKLDAWVAAIREQLEMMAEDERVPKTSIARALFTPNGDYDTDATGAPKTVRESVWLVLPDDMHNAVVLPKEEN